MLFTAYLMIRFAGPGGVCVSHVWPLVSADPPAAVYAGPEHVPDTHHSAIHTYIHERRVIRVIKIIIIIIITKGCYEHVSAPTHASVKCLIYIYRERSYSIIMIVGYIYRGFNWVY